MIKSETNYLNEILVLKKIDPISADPYDQSKMINYQKSKEIISIKAYRKALQLKGNETLMS
ncbi:MAG: hypothetical protein HKN00_00845 [Flavobacteriaceae bacterium]|nr:hypothetical protein [Bacteroidia bacterium]MBT8288116.1 hypothetical protein [Bacteroidia bacterium]NNF73703.1 hypothetical protein [Flavobacteriaceae bacterium]NNK74242.1 hypothetical protein [Flavobacteriaceae bacterium]